MAYFAAIKITDANGNIVELKDSTELLENIYSELEAIRLILEEISDVKIKED